MKEVVKLTYGQSFGELALIEDGPRQASVMAINECSCAVIGKQDYLSSLKEIETRALNRKISSVQQLPFLQHWTKGQMTRLIYSFTDKSFSRGQIVYNEGENSENIYMVKEGEFEVTRKRRVLVKAKANVNYESLIGTNPVKSYSTVSVK